MYNKRCTFQVLDRHNCNPPLATRDMNRRSRDLLPNPVRLYERENGVMSLLRQDWGKHLCTARGRLSKRNMSSAVSAEDSCSYGSGRASFRMRDPGSTRAKLGPSSHGVGCYGLTLSRLTRYIQGYFRYTQP